MGGAQTGKLDSTEPVAFLIHKEHFGAQERQNRNTLFSFCGYIRKYGGKLSTKKKKSTAGLVV